MAYLQLITERDSVGARWERALTAVGHTCSRFTSGVRAWSVLLETPPDLIISDIFVPDLDGIELLRRLRQTHMKTPVVILRGDGSTTMEALYEVATVLGAFRVVPPAMDDAGIQALVAESLRQPAALQTAFAPAERASDQEVLRQAESLRGNELFQAVLSSLKSLVLVVNEQRQIVLANEQALRVAGVSEEDAWGLRLGELLQCVHAGETPGGCGTTESCRTCGALRAILTALSGEGDLQEARLTLESGVSLDLRASTRPLDFHGERLVVLSIDDIAAENRRRVLERVFFHDVLNTAGGVQGLAALVRESAEGDREELLAMLQSTAEQLVREISSQRLLSAVESGDYRGETWPRVIADALDDAAAAQRSLAGERGVTLRVADVEEGVVNTGATLLGRVLGNLAKNAIEASTAGDSVTLSAHLEGESVTFSVHNPAVIPREVELQLFQRSFSTKGSGRGLGTYSAKLFAERYLGGAVTVATSAEAGTVFAVRLPLAGPAPSEAA